MHGTVAARVGRSMMHSTPAGSCGRQGAGSTPRQRIWPGRRARELVKLSREALALRKMQRELVEVTAVARRSFHLWRLVRDRQDAWVSRVAPLLAARFKLDEGDFWRALKGEVRKFQEELAEIDVEKGLATAPADEEAGE